MIDPFAKSLLDSAQSPMSGEEVSAYLGISYLKKIAKSYFDTPDEIDITTLNDDLSRLSLASSTLIDADINEKDLSTAFLIAESAEIAFDMLISLDDPSVALAAIGHLLDIASFFHLSNFDANANVLAEKSLKALNQPLFVNNTEREFSIQVIYYRSLGYFLKGRFGDLITESQKKLSPVLTQDLVFIRLIEILVELTNYYRGLNALSDKSVSDLSALSEILTISGLYTILSSETSRLQSFANAAKQKALYPLLSEKFHEQKKYLDTRASGIVEGAYPFAWPPIRAFCEEYLEGKNHHAVISLPTGSGKSFLAELAIVESIQKGWVLYLAPTNALCAQIKNDLNKNLATVESSKIDLFLGGIEYIPDVEGLQPSQNHVAVMTPEKASLLIKLYPDKIKNCSLIILDECHVLGESNRGAITEFVLSKLVSDSPDIRIVFMSALIGNSEDLGNWLTIKTKRTAAMLRNDWRPTRSSRVILTQDWNNRRSQQDKNKIKYYLPIVAVADAYTPWTKDNEHYYSWQTKLEIKSSDPQNFKPSKNDIAKDLAMSLATKKVQTLIIVFSSKHGVFSTAEKIQGLPENAIVQSQAEFDWLEIAKYELGIESKVQTLISDNQVSVHSTIMLQAERKASEEAYNRERTKIMISTTTLAQGLNLNSQVVILAGTEFYVDPQEYDDDEMLDMEVRSLQQVLNGCGRAARANVVNRGFSVIIPSPRVIFPGNDVKTTILGTIPVLSEKENIFVVSSRIRDLLVQVQINNQEALPNSAELQIILLMPVDRHEGEKFLNSTLASINFSDDQLINIIARLDYIKHKFVADGIPEWLLKVSHLSNVDIGIVIELRNYILKLGDDVTVESYSDLAFFIIDWLQQLNPHTTWEFLVTHVKRWRYYWGDDKDPPFADQVKEDENVLDSSEELLGQLWQNLRECVSLWLNDGTYLDIGNALVRGKCEDGKFPNRSHAGFPIPRSIIWSQKTMDKLSIIAGCLSALRDIWRINDEGSLPKWLADSKIVQSLPMAIRFGVSSPTSLTWYRSVIGERRTANLLSQQIPLVVDNPLDDDETRRFLSSAIRRLHEDEELVNKNELIMIVRRLSNK